MRQRSYLLWQLLDSALPTGALAHSGGLEAQIQVHGCRDIAASIRSLTATCLAQQLPLVEVVYNQPGALAAQDQYCAALLSNHVARRASLAQGQALLCVLEQMALTDACSQLRQDIRNRHIAGHLPPIFGFVFRHCEISLQQCRESFAFITVRDLFSAAVRLGVCGPMQAQRQQYRLMQDIDRMLAVFAGSEAQHIHPIQDIVHGMHDRLYSRLFSS